MRRACRRVETLGNENRAGYEVSMTSKLLRFRVEKLIRDDMVEALHAKGLRTFERHLDKHELERCLLNKLVEEAEEVRGAGTRSELIEELADVHEVLFALLAAHDISAAEIEARRLTKRARFGGFDRGVYNAAVEVAEDNDSAAYYMARPEKYPQS